MGKFVGSCVALFVLAAGFIVLTEGQEISALLSALWSEPPLGMAAWVVVVLAPLLLVAAAIWLAVALMGQRKTAQALALRLDGVRQGVKALAQSQVDAEAAVHHLARTDPEAAIGAVQQRLAEAERVAHVQQARNDIGDLQSRVDSIRAQQQALKEQLAPVLEKRRTIERLFLELDTRQNDIDRSLHEIASGDDAVDLDTRLKKLAEFLKQGNGRCQEIERAAETAVRLKEEFSVLGSRLAPFAAPDDGVTSRVRELREAADALAAGIDTLQQAPEGALGDRVQKLAEDRKRLDDGLAQLNTQFYKLAMLRKDIAGLFSNFSRILDILAIPAGDGSAADIDARLAALVKFIENTQAHLDDIEHRMVVFGHLKSKLGELQSRLVPLESEETGVVSVIEEVRDLRDRLAVKIAHIEEDDEGSLAERVKKFAETKRELEQRVISLTDQFSKLAAIRNDIAGVFEKLTSAVSASAN
jgi:chromosome segregation ATPase